MVDGPDADRQAPVVRGKEEAPAEKEPAGRTGRSGQETDGAKTGLKSGRIIGP
jgi:hypothetical protein